MSDFYEDEEFDDDEDFEEITQCITLADDTGREFSFEILGDVELYNRHFSVLLPFEDEDGEVVILELIPDENSEEGAYISVGDENLLDEVFAKFKNDYNGEYEFE